MRWVMTMMEEDEDHLTDHQKEMLPERVVKRV